MLKKTSTWFILLASCFCVQIESDGTAFWFTSITYINFCNCRTFECVAYNCFAILGFSCDFCVLPSKDKGFIWFDCSCDYFIKYFLYWNVLK
jgi:hypothetical protein